MGKLVYKYWRIIGTGFSFTLFGLGAFFMAIGVLLFVYPLPVKRSTKRRWARHIVWRATWLYVRIMRSLKLLTFEFNNIEVLREKGQLVIANHPSLLDVVFLMSLMPDTNCIVKAAMFKNPFTFGIVSLAGYIPNSENGEDLVNRAAEAINKGETLIIFPEGTRTTDFSHLRFKRGAANIALKAQCPIRPVVITCEPITLRKNEPWYRVPESPPHFKLRSLPIVQANHTIDITRPSSVQARHLTRALQETYSEQLSLC